MRRAACSISSHRTGRLGARDQVLHHAVLQRLVAEARPQRPIDARRDRPGLAAARVDGARVGVRALVRLDPAEHPLGPRIQPVEIQVHRDRVDRTRGAHHLGCHQLGAGPVLGLGRQDEARIVRVVDVALVIVVVDPRREPAAQPLDERQRRLVERRAAPLARERDVEHRHPPFELRGGRQRARRQEREARQRRGRWAGQGGRKIADFPPDARLREADSRRWRRPAACAARWARCSPSRLRYGRSAAASRHRLTWTQRKPGTQEL